MKKDAIYIVVGNRTGGLKHFCQEGEIVIGTGIRHQDQSPPEAHRYEREDYQVTGHGIQWIHPKDVIKIGEL